MRWLFLILLLLNGVLYAWFMQEAQQRERAAARLQPDHTGLAPLVKLSEVPAGRLQPRVAEAPPAPAASRALRSVPAKPEQVPTAVVEEKTPPPAVAVCYEVGFFAEKGRAEAFAAKLPAEAATGEVFQSRYALEPDHWVYVEAPGAARQVAQLQRALKADGLDSYLIQEGALAGAVSVGLYRNKESAQALLEALLAKEYRAKMFLKPRWEQAWVVQVRTEELQRWEGFWSRVRAELPDQVKSEKKSCTRVATEQGAE